MAPVNVIISLHYYIWDLSKQYFLLSQDGAKWMALNKFLCILIYKKYGIF